MDFEQKPYGLYPCSSLSTPIDQTEVVDLFGDCHREGMYFPCGCEASFQLICIQSPVLQECSRGRCEIAQKARGFVFCPPPILIGPNFKVAESRHARLPTGHFRRPPLKFSLSLLGADRIVFTNSFPACASPSSTWNMQDPLKMYKVSDSNLFVSISSPSPLSAIPSNNTFVRPSVTIGHSFAPGSCWGLVHDDGYLRLLGLGFLKESGHPFLISHPHTPIAPAEQYVFRGGGSSALHGEICREGLYQVRARCPSLV